MARTVSWGVLSTARIGVERVIPAMQKGEISRIDAIASRDAAHARTVADQLGIPKAYGSYEELLADPGIEAIYNPLPNHLHVPWTVKAMEAGKHVLCEKQVRRCGRGNADLRSIYPARRCLLAHGARRGRAGVPHRRRRDQHAGHRCVLPLGAQRQLGTRSGGLTGLRPAAEPRRLAVGCLTGQAIERIGMGATSFPARRGLPALTMGARLRHTPAPR